MPLVAVVFTAGTSQRGGARSRPLDVGVAEGGFQRRDLAFTKVVRRRFMFNGLFEIDQTAPSFMHRSQTSNRRAMHTDLRLAHSLFMWILATVKLEHDWSSSLRNLSVPTMHSTALVEYLSEQETWISVYVKSSLKETLFGRFAQWN